MVPSFFRSYCTRITSPQHVPRSTTSSYSDLPRTPNTDESTDTHGPPLPLFLLTAT